MNLQRTILDNTIDLYFQYSETFKNKNLIRSYLRIGDNIEHQLISKKRLLIDGHFYNLGYFYRLQLVRAALHSKSLDESAFLWKHNKKICTNLLKSLGIKNIVDMSPKDDISLLEKSKAIFNNIKSAEDVLEIDFPHNMPAYILYDYILKAQRLPSLNVRDKSIISYIYEYLYSIKSTEKILKELNPDIIAMSHAISIQCAPMALLATKLKIPVLILHGNFGTPRPWKVTNSNKITFGFDHPVIQDLENIPEDKIQLFSELGKSYLDQRIKGNTTDIGSKYAYIRVKNKELQIDLKSDKRPVIAIYIGTWIDFPHTFGMSRFIDVLDWLKNTLEVAKKNDNVIWLLREHPVNKWYGATKLEDVIPTDLPSHIVQVPDGYSGKEMIESADALVTIHGTSGLEYAALGKPVLIADKGWYHNFGFALYPDSKEHYLELLATDWYNKVDITAARSRARIFAGMYFCVPNWQSEAILPDDSDRKVLRSVLPSFIDKNIGTIQKEVSEIKQWIESDEVGYHTFKIKKAQSYKFSNIKLSK